ncbi:glutaredoxin-related protein 5, mitochondrial [Zeugodacus cucurbitae]|uniref:glutaredoxin-related protein 5, mitochondrial n=1 Tax=Zeugodacus cucurbitae TaxID=28588 RepID=UPI0005969B80|nr:glutaredoxin-related protein 5, mitochondrial [Zeugodacus cucurbitae]
MSGRLILRQLFRQAGIAQRMSVIKRYESASTATGTTSNTKQPTFNKDTLKQLVNTNKVVIFMKGNPETPKCGFSNAVVQILRMHGVQYDAHDVLQSDELRQSIKEFSDWPTIPQVYINGEFVGGCDILLQMHQSGDLIDELKKVGIESLLLTEAQNADKGSPKDTKPDQK